MSRPVRVTALCLLVPVLALSSCSGDAGAGGTPTPSGPDATEWADSVCTSVGALIADLEAIGSGLSVELGTGDALEQIKTQLATDIAGVGESVDAVVAAIGEAPDVEGAEDLQDDLQQGSAAVASATEDAKDAARVAAGATTLTEFLSAAGTAMTATSSALSAAQSYAASVATAASAAGETVQAAFAGEESCTALADRS
jgi:uncharacterized protein YoxC